MDLANLFNNFDRIALSLERIATALEDRNAGGDNTISVSVSGDTATVDKPKRTRRTKEQIAADEEAARIAAAAQVPPVAPVVQPQEVVQVAATFQSAPVGQPAAIGVPPVSQPVGVQPPAAAAPIPVAAPVMETPAPLAPPAAVAPPVTATIPAPTATTAPAAVSVASTPEEDFTHLYNTVAPVFAAGRDHIVALLGQYGLQMPISHPDDQSAPGDQFRAMNPEHRRGLLSQAEALAAQLVARAGQL